MTEQTKSTGDSATSKTNGFAAMDGNGALDRERIVAEYERSRDAWLQRAKLEQPPEMSEEEILDLAVELCRRPTDA